MALTTGENMNLSERGHLPWIDWIRFLAALIVLLAHARGYVFLAYNNLDAGSKGALCMVAFLATRIEHEAVIVFFVLSGYLVGGRGVERLARGTFRPKDYVIDRCSRILVPLFPALLVTLVCGVILGQATSIGDLLGNIAGLQGVLVNPINHNIPLWSLAYEYWFYIFLWAAAIITSSNHVHRWSGLSVILLVFLVFTYLKPVFLFSWIIGTVMWFVRIRSWKIFFFCVGGVIMIYAVAGIQLIQDSEGEKAAWILQLAKWYPNQNVIILLLSVGVSIVVASLVELHPRSKTMIKFERTGAWLAGFSYTLYLTHFPLLRLLPYYGLQRDSHVNTASIFTYLIICGSCLIVAWLAYLPFEKQTGKIRKWIKIKVS